MPSLVIIGSVVMETKTVTLSLNKLESSLRKNILWLKWQWLKRRIKCARKVYDDNYDDDNNHDGQNWKRARAFDRDKLFLKANKKKLNKNNKKNCTISVIRLLTV